MGKSMRFPFVIFVVLMALAVMVSGCSSDDEQGASNEATQGENNATTGSNSEETKVEIDLYAKVELDKTNGPVREKVKVTVTDLIPNTPVSLLWDVQDGNYDLEGVYSFLGISYEHSTVELASGTSDADGKWVVDLEIPEGYGGDHTIMIMQNGKQVGQANFLVDTVFSIYPTSGPIGTEITIIGEGVGWREYGSIWHLNWDNNYMGMITAVTTNGKAVAKIRAAGDVGLHSLTFESGAHGLPYLNRTQSPINYVKTQVLYFEITSDEPAGDLTYVEPAPPSAADGGIFIPAPQNKDGVTVTLDKSEGIVGEPVVMTASGLPANTTFDLIWHTMVGNRVSGNGFGEQTSVLDQVTTDANGAFTYHFTVPDDLGGAPHLIDIALNEEVYGQTYLRILPSIYEITQTEAPVGTVINVTLKGVGWTEFDNIMLTTYDNVAVGYMCGFNSQGTVKFPIVAAGDPGWHIVDIYPGIYKGGKQMPNVYIKPQLTYYEDHPGTAIPAVRIGIKVTE